MLDGEERAAGTDPNLWDTDGDGISDYTEIMESRGGVATDPLRPDQLLDFRFTNMTILGGCPVPEGAGDDALGEYEQWFSGLLKIEFPDGTVNTMAELSEADGQPEGATIALTNTPASQPLALGQDQTFRVFSGPVSAGYRLTHAWLGGTFEGTTNRLGDFSQSYDYPANGGSFNVKLSGPYEDPEENAESCEISISWLIERLR